ncbi:MAG: FtsQ-type POTRA domain-containing protein [Treponema sp.]|nr:FtsQ-type POTRA domain-containing protein [Treponema sp.]MCL2237020.1 FtsQ-type POTRA domain-containing protein [Treponema sp.]
MGTEYYYIDSEEINARKAKSSGKVEKGLKRLLVVAAAIFFAQMVWLFGISPFIPFSTIEVHGFTELGRADVLMIAGIDDTSSFFSTNARDVQEKVSSNILVESAVVMKRFPDRISIFLTPRKAAAVTLASYNSRQVPIFIDRQGVFYKMGNSTELGSCDLPVISGIENPQLNMRLPASLVTLVESLSNMAQSSPELLSAVSEIRIERKTWDGFDLVIFPVHSPIKVRVENNISEDTLRYMLLMLNVFENDSNHNDLRRPSEIDFRSGMGSYKIKEQS